jgi:hypothetical protein
MENNEKSAKIDSLKIACQMLCECEDEIEKIELTLKDQKTRRDALRLKTIPDLLEEEGLKNATFEGIGRVQVTSDLQCTTKAGKKMDAIQWLQDSGYVDMVREDYNAISMKALIRRMLVDGADIPEFLNVHTFQRASVTRT